MHRKTFHIISIVVLVCTIGNAKAWEPWNRETTILARISAPTFSTASTNVAITTDARYRIQLAINNRSTAGGGKVILNGAGTYVCKGPIVLKNNVNLVINSGATLKFAYPALNGNTFENYLRGPGTSGTYLTKWEGTWVYKRAPMIYAYNQTNIAVTGAGAIDANKAGGLVGWNALDEGDKTTLRGWGWSGTAIASRVMGDASRLRPGVIEPVKCKNILIDGITILNSCWWQIHPISCTNVKVSNCKPNSGSEVNGDGIDIEGCNDVLVEKCKVTSGDDAIVLKSGRDNDGWASSPMGQKMSEDIVVRQCNLMNNGGGAISVGSEVSGGIRNVFISQCTTNVAKITSHFVFIKTVACRGAEISNINVKNCVNTKGTSNNALRIDPRYKQADCADSTYPTDIHDISITGFTQTASSGGKGILVKGYDASNQTRNVTVTNVSVSPVAIAGIDTTFTANVIFSNVIMGATGYTFTNGALVSVTGITLNATSRTIASVGGTFDLAETVSPTNATNKEILWTSSNEAVATVDYCGLVTAKANGTATITAMCQDDNTKTATCTITVGGGATVSCFATKDAFTRNGTYATVNYGTATTLVVKLGSTSYTRKTYMTFDVSAAKSCASAKLKWFVSQMGTTGPVTLDIDKIETAWDESTINWNNAPATVTTHISTSKVVSAVGWQELDISSVVSAEMSGGDKVFTIAFSSLSVGSDNAMYLTSKESAAKPVVEVTEGMGKRAAETDESAASQFAKTASPFIDMHAGMIVFFSNIERNVSIVNMSGQTLTSKHIGANETVVIPEAKFVPGVYLLQMIDNDGHRISKIVRITGK